MTVTNRATLLFLLALINFTHIVDSMLIMPLGDIFIKEFNISASQYSFLVSGYALAAFASGLAGIFLIDRFDRKTSLLFVYSGFAIGTILCGFMNTYYSLLIFRIITGLFGGIIGAIVLSVVSDLYLFAERGKAMGYLFAAFSAASAFGVPIGIYLADLSTWRLPFIIIGSLGVVIAITLFYIFPTLTDHLKLQSKQNNLKKTITNIIHDKNQVNALIAGFVLILAHFMIIPFISPYIIRNVGLSQKEIAYQFFLGGVATLFTSPIVGRLTDSKGVMKVFTILMLLSFIPTVLITNLPPIHIAIALTITTFFFVFASGRMIAPNTIITAAAPQANRGSFMSLKSSLQQLAIGLSGLISGQIIFINDQGLYQNYYIVGMISIVLGLMSIYFVAKIRVAKGN